MSDLDDRIRAALLEGTLQPARTPLTAHQVRLRGTARRRRRQLALTGGGLALAAGGLTLVAGLGWGTGAARQAGRSAAPSSGTAWPTAGRAQLDAARAAVADYYRRLPPDTTSTTAEAEVAALAEQHLTATARAEAASLSVGLARPADTLPAVCGTRTAALRVGPLTRTGAHRAGAVVSGASDRTVITVELDSGRISGWTCG